MAVMAAMGYMLWDPSRRERCVSFIPGLGGGDSPPGGGYKPMGYNVPMLEFGQDEDEDEDEEDEDILGLAD
jgi:hypothetical protein